MDGYCGAATNPKKNKTAMIAFANVAPRPPPAGLRESCRGRFPTAPRRSESSRRGQQGRCRESMSRPLRNDAAAHVLTLTRNWMRTTDFTLNTSSPRRGDGRERKPSVPLYLSRVEFLLEAKSESRRASREPGLCGAAAKPIAALLQAEPNEWGVGDQVRICSEYVSELTYNDFLAAADAGIQLRIYRLADCPALCWIA